MSEVRADTLQKYVSVITFLTFYDICYYNSCQFGVLQSLTSNGATIQISTLTYKLPSYWKLLIHF